MCSDTPWRFITYKLVSTRLRTGGQSKKWNMIFLLFQFKFQFKFQSEKCQSSFSRNQMNVLIWASSPDREHTEKKVEINTAPYRIDISCLNHINGVFHYWKSVRISRNNWFIIGLSWIEHFSYISCNFWTVVNVIT